MQTSSKIVAERNQLAFLQRDVGKQERRREKSLFYMVTLSKICNKIPSFTVIKL